MSGGSNGLKPHEVLQTRAKCPDSPTKKRYKTYDEAWDAARERSIEAKLEIVAYLCGGCGYFHLTKKSTGTDVALSRGAATGLTTPSTRKQLTAVPIIRVSERRELPLEEGPIVPGNKEARRKILAEYLSDNPQPFTSDITEAIPGVTPHTLRQDLAELGYVPVNDGQRKRWVPKGGHLQAVEGGRKSKPKSASQRARLRKLKAFLKDNPTPKTSALLEVVDVGKAQLKNDMEAIGWSLEGWARGAHWVNKNPDLHIADPETDTPEPATEDTPDTATEDTPVETETLAPVTELTPLDASMTRHPAGNEGVWADVDVAKLADMPLNQVLQVLEATGVEVRFQVLRPS